MPNSDNKRGVQRFGEESRKDQLDRPENLFASDEQAEFDVDSLSLPDEDAEALAALSALDDEFRPPRITPPEDRYPPLRPQAMTEPEQAATPPPKPTTQRSSSRNGLYNAITALMVLSSLAFIAWLVMVWNNPQSALNPFPPPTPFVVMTATPDGDTFAQAGATPDAEGQIFVVITSTPAEETTNNSPFPFSIGEVMYSENQNALGCDWWSITGTVTDRSSEGLAGYRVQMTAADGTVEAVFSGAMASLGAGAYEFALEGNPRQAEFVVQLFDTRGSVLSDEVTVQMSGNCDANVAQVDFLQNP